MSKLLVVIAATFSLCNGQGLDIPIFGPLGGLRIQPGENGMVGVGLHSGLKVFGNGYEKDINFVAGDGTFESGSSGGVLVDGKTYGPNSQFGVNKQQGLTFGSDLDIAKNNHNTGLNIFGNQHSLGVHRLCSLEHYNQYQLLLQQQQFQKQQLLQQQAQQQQAFLQQQSNIFSNSQLGIGQQVQKPGGLFNFAHGR